MRLAMFALTQNGAELALRLSHCCDDAQCFLPARLTEIDAPQARRFARLGDVVPGAFRAFDGLVFLMASGIVVRQIAPLLESKLTDPAVVVGDERGHHMISLLSGHLGGANTLTRQLAAFCGADPVITTATDTEGKTAPDVIAAALALRPVPKAAIFRLNTELLTGKMLTYAVDPALTQAAFYEERLQEFGVTLASTERADVIVTDDMSKRSTGNRRLCLVPRRLIAGVGCRRGVSKEEILDALSAATAKIGRDVTAIDVIASTVHKKDEAGFIEAAAKLDRPFHIFADDVMKTVAERAQLRLSPFVMQTLGIGNVAEAAALAETGENGGRFALPKTIFGKVTVALVWEK